MRRKFLIIILLTTTVFFFHAAFARPYGQLLCKTPGFHCKHVKSGQSWRSLWPNEHDRDIVMRINRMNTQLYAGLILAVPDDLGESDIMDYSPFPKRVQPLEEKTIFIDPENIAWGAYDIDGTLVRWGPISAGANFCRDIQAPCQTHSGAFRVFSLGSSDCISRKFPLPEGGAPMPYCMYFNNGQALHGEPNGLPGYNASHGCVRLYVNDAEWLRYSFIQGPGSDNEYRGTKVIVGSYSADDLAAAKQAEQNSPKYRHYDETDDYESDDDGGGYY